MHADPKQLERPPWSALTTTHSDFALGNDLARRYQPDIAPMAAIREVSDTCLQAMAALMSPGEVVGLFDAEAVSAGGELVAIAHKTVEQMVNEQGRAAPFCEEYVRSYSGRRTRNDAAYGIDKARAVFSAHDCARLLYRHQMRREVGGDGGRTDEVRWLHRNFRGVYPSRSLQAWSRVVTCWCVDAKHHLTRRNAVFTYLQR